MALGESSMSFADKYNRSEDENGNNAVIYLSMDTKDEINQVKNVDFVTICGFLDPTLATSKVEE